LRSHIKFKAGLLLMCQLSAVVTLNDESLCV